MSEEEGEKMERCEICGTLVPSGELQEHPTSDPVLGREARKACKHCREGAVPVHFGN